MGILATAESAVTLESVVIQESAVILDHQDTLATVVYQVTAVVESQVTLVVVQMCE